MPRDGKNVIGKSTALWLVFGVLSAHAEQKLEVVATTTLVGDVVRQVAGGLVQLRTLLPPGCDPHAFVATPRDAVSLADADTIFVNGFGLESSYLPGLLTQSRTKARVVEVSDGIVFRTWEENGERDPHVWFNPLNVKTWAQNIEQTLQGLDPAHAGDYQSRSARFQIRLEELDAWAAEELRRVGKDSRNLVTDHDALGYFADHFGYKVIGVVIPGFSTGAEPSARELARLEDTITHYNVKAIFAGKAVNADVARRVANDIGVRLVSLDIESLPPGADYFSFMTNIVKTIVEALQ
jgi:ABC-type Zn uptake system ZnuABC Zn-binding protein ZnuA